MQAHMQLPKLYHQANQNPVSSTALHWQPLLLDVLSARAHNHKKIYLAVSVLIFMEFEAHSKPDQMYYFILYWIVTGNASCQENTLPKNKKTPTFLMLNQWFIYSLDD